MITQKKPLSFSALSYAMLMLRIARENEAESIKQINRKEDKTGKTFLGIDNKGKMIYNKVIESHNNNQRPRDLKEVMLMGNGDKYGVYKTSGINQITNDLFDKIKSQTRKEK